MTESNKSSPPKGDFIDLDKNQYKKNNKIKRYVIVIFSTFLITILIFFYLNNFNIKEFLYRNFDNNGSSSTEVGEEKINTNENHNFNKQINFLKKINDFLKQESFENTEKLSNK